MDKNYIINQYSKLDFMHFLEDDYNGQVLSLLDTEGIDILKKSELCLDRINYILSFSKYRNEILQNNTFLDMLFERKFDFYYLPHNGLTEATYNFIINKAMKLNIDTIYFAQMFRNFSIDYKLKILDDWPFNEEYLYKIIENDELSVINKIFSQYRIDLTKHNINLYNLFDRAKEVYCLKYDSSNSNNQYVESIEIPYYMITKGLARFLWNNNDIFKLRTIISNAYYCTDPEVINNYVKEKEDLYIKNSINEEILEPYNTLFILYKNYMDEVKLSNSNDEYDDNKLHEYRMKYIRFLNKIDDESINSKLKSKYDTGGINEVWNYLLNLSNNCISNYIIDYHFEENFHNVIIDVRELLNFYFNGNIDIPMERLEIYEKISNIDFLSIEEKIELHEYLKNYNMIEQFYDDMAYARKIVGNAIKDYSLAQKDLIKYKDYNLSKEYGVDVYVLDGDPFFGIVKTGRHIPDDLPTGHSYSLIGNNGLVVYGDVSDSNTFLYDSDTMNPDQLVHAFPFDSFTFYRPFKYSKGATSRVNMLNMPDEILNLSTSYTELLLLEKGKDKTEMDARIPELKRIALYCLDEIRYQDVDVAKKNGVGIVLVKSSKYIKEQHRHIHSSIYSIGEHNYDYFNGIYEKEKFESRRI